MARGAQKTSKRDEAIFSQMKEWPRSWAACPEDLPVGESLLEHLEAFIRDLRARGLSDRTIRRHLDNAWVIGGEIISRFGLYPEERKTSGGNLLHEAVCCDEAPLISRATEEKQRSADATARKIHAFLRRMAG
jgi:hypothetical protein